MFDFDYAFEVFLLKLNIRFRRYLLRLSSVRYSIIASKKSSGVLYTLTMSFINKFNKIDCFLRDATNNCCYIL